MKLSTLVVLGVLAFCVAGTASAVHVHGYTRKDGTYVHPHERRAAGTASSSHSKASTTSHPKSSTSSSAPRDANGHIKRSSSARSAFEHSHPCPSTGKTSGACPGYVVDHVVPLKRGGADAPGNMQWQTVEAAKQKDKTE